MLFVCKCHRYQPGLSIIERHAEFRASHRSRIFFHAVIGVILFFFFLKNETNASSVSERALVSSRSVRFAEYKWKSTFAPPPPPFHSHGRSPLIYYWGLPFHCKSSSHLGMSNISANSGGNLSFVQFLRNQSRRLACLAPSALSSGILCETLVIAVTVPPAPSPAGRVACTLSASSTRSCSLCTALTSFSPGRSFSSTAAENRPSSVSVSWWAFSDDVACISADTKSGCRERANKNYTDRTIIKIDSRFIIYFFFLR